jgi:hypothetical protein
MQWEVVVEPLLYKPGFVTAPTPYAHAERLSKAEASLTEPTYAMRPNRATIQRQPTCHEAWCCHADAMALQRQQHVGETDKGGCGPVGTHPFA